MDSDSSSEDSMDDSSEKDNAPPVKLLAGISKVTFDESAASSPEGAVDADEMLTKKLRRASKDSIKRRASRVYSLRKDFEEMHKESTKKANFTPSQKYFDYDHIRKGQKRKSRHLPTLPPTQQIPKGRIVAPKLRKPSNHWLLKRDAEDKRVNRKREKRRKTQEFELQQKEYELHQLRKQKEYELQQMRKKIEGKRRKEYKEFKKMRSGIEDLITSLHETLEDADEMMQYRSKAIRPGDVGLHNLSDYSTEEEEEMEARDTNPEYFKIRALLIVNQIKNEIEEITNITEKSEKSQDALTSEIRDIIQSGAKGMTIRKRVHFNKEVTELEQFDSVDNEVRHWADSLRSGPEYYSEADDTRDPWTVPLE